MNVIQDSLSTILLASPESKTVILKEILSQIQTKAFLSKDLFNPLIDILQLTLNDPNIEISLLSSNLLTEIIQQKENKSYENNFSECLNSVVRNLGDSQPALRKASHSFLMKFIKITGNFDDVFKAFSINGFENENWQIRQKSINSFQSLIISEQAHIIWESLILKKLTENLIDKLNDGNSIIAKASEQSLLSLNHNQNFKILFKNLSTPYQELFKNFIVSYKNKLINNQPIPQNQGISPIISNNTLNSNIKTKELNKNENNLQSPTPKSANYNFVNVGQNIASSSIENEKINKENENLRKSKDKTINTDDVLNLLNKDQKEKKNSKEDNFILNKNKEEIQNHSLNNPKIYGVFNIKTINDLSENKEWQIRSSAIEEVEKIIDGLGNKIQEFIPHLYDFLKLLIKLIHDSNFKICITTVNILSKIIGIKELSLKQNIELIFPKLIEKFGDSKIAIRQASVKIVKELFQNGKNNIDQFYWIETTLPSLDHSNQYIREECLNLLTFVISEFESFPNTYYEKLLLIVTSFLEDIKLKVKSAAIDTIISISKKMNKYNFHSFLQKSLTHEGYELVQNNLPEYAQIEIEEKFKSEEKISYSYQKNERSLHKSQTPEIIKTKSIAKNEEDIGEYHPTSMTPQQKHAISLNEIPNSIPNNSNKKPNSNNNNNQRTMDRKKGTPFEVSTASSSRSTATHQIGNETLNNLNEKAKITRISTKKASQIDKKTLIEGNRTQSAQDYAFDQSKEDDKRTLSAFTLNEGNLTEELEKINENKSNRSDSKSSIRENKTIKKNSNLEEKNEKEMILEYSLKKNLEEFTLNKGFNNEEYVERGNKTIPPSKSKNDSLTYSLKNNNNNITKPPINKKIAINKSNIRNNNQDILEIQSKEYKDNNKVKKSNSEEKGNYYSNEEIAENDEIIQEEEDRKSFKSDFSKPKSLKSIKLNKETKSNFDYKQANYLEKEDLEPATNPDKLYKSVLNDIKTDDWSQQFGALNNLRRLVCYHPDTIMQNSSYFHSLMLELVKLIESLRSSVSKNAMMTSMELVETLKKFVDPEVELILTRLIKKGLDANAFISEEVKKGLITVCTNCSETKTIPVLINMSNTKSIQGKINLIVCFDSIIEKNGCRIFNIRDSDKMICSLVSYIFDGSNEVRIAAKSTFLKLYETFIDQNELLKILQFGLNEMMYNKLKILIEKEFKSNNQKNLLITKSTGPKIPLKSKEKTFKKSSTPDQIKVSDHLFDSDKKGDIEINNYVKGDTIKSSVSVKGFNLTSNKLKNSQEIDNLSSTFVNCISNDWKTRLDSIKIITQTAQNYADVLAKHKLANNFIDIFLKLINDPNAKVSQQALTSFNMIIEDIQSVIEPNLTNVVNSIFQVLASFNSNIKESAEETLNSLMNTFDKSLFVHTLCNGAIYAVSRSRNIIILKLYEIIEEIYEKKPSFIVKYVNPLIIKLCEENKSELKASLQKLVLHLFQLGNSEFIESFPSNKIKMIMEIIGKVEK